MRNLKSYVAMLPIVVGSFFITACDNGKEKIAQLQQQNEELSAAGKKDSLYIASMNSEMDELYANLDSMRAREERIRQATEKLRAKTMGGKEGSVTIDESFAQLEKMLAQNKQKIASLQKKLAESDKKNVALQKMVDELQKQMQDKDLQIDGLKSQVATLSKEVEDLKVANAQISTEKEQTAKQLTETTDALNAVFYVTGAKKDLEKKGVIDTRGLFKKLDGLAAGIDESAFVKGDKRYLKEINAGQAKAKNVELVPKRDESSYKLVEANGEVVVQIVDAEKFWKAKYVAVVLK
jgi:chromosome segregation ATPase